MQKLIMLSLLATGAFAADKNTPNAGAPELILDSMFFASEAEDRDFNTQKTFIVYSAGSCLRRLLHKEMGTQDVYDVVFSVKDGLIASGSGAVVSQIDKSIPAIRDLHNALDRLMTKRVRTGLETFIIQATVHSVINRFKKASN